MPIGRNAIKDQVIFIFTVYISVGYEVEFFGVLVVKEVIGQQLLTGDGVKVSYPQVVCYMQLEMPS